MKDYVRWALVVLMTVLLVFLLRWVKQLDIHEVAGLVRFAVRMGLVSSSG